MDTTEAKFWPMFSQVMGKPVSPGHYDKADLPEWDSLRHVELIFALEDSFGVAVPRDKIADLSQLKELSSFLTVSSFLQRSDIIFQLVTLSRFVGIVSVL